MKTAAKYLLAAIVGIILFIISMMVWGIRDLQAQIEGPITRVRAPEILTFDTRTNTLRSTDTLRLMSPAHTESLLKVRDGLEVNSGPPMQFNPVGMKRMTERFFSFWVPAGGTNSTNVERYTVPSGHIAFYIPQFADGRLEIFHVGADLWVEYRDPVTTMTATMVRVEEWAQ